MAASKDLDKQKLYLLKTLNEYTVSKNGKNAFHYKTVSNSWLQNLRRKRYTPLKPIVIVGYKKKDKFRAVLK